MLACMNYGQLLEHLKNAGADQPVRLRSADETDTVDLVMHDETGVYLVCDTDREPGYPEAEKLLVALRGMEIQPEFTLPVFGEFPGGSGLITEVIDENRTLVFPFTADTDEQFAQRGPGDPAHENAALPSRAIIQHDFEAVPGFETAAPGGSAPLCVHCDQAADAPVHQIDATPRHLSPPAAGVLNAMGLGMRLRVPHDGGPAMLHDSTDQGRESLGPVNPDHVQELVNCGQITKLTKDRNGSRLGWAEKGLDGDVADFYACVQ